VDPFAAELVAYRTLASGGEAPAPRLLDHVDGVLAIGVVDGRPLHEALAASADPARLLWALGTALAKVHDLPMSADVPRRRPWVLDVCSIGLPHLLAGDDALVALVGVVAGDASLRAALERGAAAWVADGFVHGDVKFDNVLVDGDGVVQLVDWELAGRGATVWDLAGVVDGLVVPAIAAGDPRPLEVMGDAEPALDAYRIARGRAPDGGWSVEAATVARLVQSAIQLAAMRHDEPDCERVADAVLHTAGDLAANLPQDLVAA
jgi:Ser/Thr protein kinase RdoA (MazF antagonist)